MALRPLRLLGAILLIEVSRAELALLKVDKRQAEYPAGLQDVFCLVFNPSFRPLPSSDVGQSSAPVANFSDFDGCSDFPATTDLTGKVVAVARGNCTFAEKASRIQGQGGLAALIVDYANETSMVPPGGNSTDYNTINITLAIILNHDFAALMDFGADVKVWMYSPDPPNFDPNIIVMFALATLCVVTGSFLAASKHKRMVRRGTRAEGSSEEDEDEKSDDGHVSLGMGVAMSVGLVVFFCISITLLYFFYDYLVYVIIGVFCIAGINGLYQAFSPLWSRLMPCDVRLPLSGLPFVSSSPKLRDVILVLLSAGFVAVWVVFRHASFAWILQDIIGFCFCLYVMMALVMPSLKSCTVLLSLLFLYDIFFVFITPLFTKNGESVMIKVATGGDSTSGEQMPTVFRMPYFISRALAQCLTDKYSLLGYGDVIVPGLLITYNCIFDMKTHTSKQGRWKHVYFVASSVAYVAGLLLTGLALYVMKSGQPALLYLVPSTILTTVIIAACRGELGHMWTGHKNPKKDDNVGATRSTTTTAGRHCQKRSSSDCGGEEEEEEEAVGENQSLIQ